MDKQRKKRKGIQVPRIPSKPNKKTRLTNQLRLNYKEFWSILKRIKSHSDWSLGYWSRPISICQYGVDSHTYLERDDKGQYQEKCSKGETSCVKFVVLKTWYIVDPKSEQNVGDNGLNLDEDSDDIILYRTGPYIYFTGYQMRDKRKNINGAWTLEKHQW